MAELTSRERVARILRREPVDRIACLEGFWEDTRLKWVAEGHVKENESLDDHFGLDMRLSWGFNSVADLDCKEEVIEETGDSKLVRNGNGAVLRWWKNGSGTPEHVDFLVKDRRSWEEYARPRLVDPDVYRRRIHFEAYRRLREKCARENLFFCWSGVNVFELMHPVCGHEHMLMGMALDPEWIQDMATVFSELVMNLMDILFAEEGPPDGVFYFEDMGFKERPFMSPAMYKDLIWPAHRRTFQHAHDRGLPVLVHSCGFVEPLLPGLVEAGMDCLQAMEVKAGMDLLRIKKQFGDRITLFGGLDVREIESNDKRRIETELLKKVPTAMAGGGYMLHSDHSISQRVEYDSYRYFLDRGLEIGTY